MAKRVLKTYQATKSQQLDTYCLVEGQKVAIAFRGGTITPRKNGIYQTSDPKIIAQMDADIVRVGADIASYKCISEEVIQSDEPVEGETLNTNPSTENAVPGIKTVTAAKEWLLSASETGIIKKGITPSMIRNRTDVLKIAGENNVNFTDLSRES